MKHFELISQGVDVAPLLAEIDGRPDLWDRHSVRKDAPGSPHKQMSDIWVRFNDAEPFESGRRPWAEFSDEHTPVLYPAWWALPSLRPIIFDLMRKVEAQALYGVLITRIPPGGRIERHADDSWHVQFTDKLYLSLKSAPGAVFGCDHDGIVEELNPRPGEVWLFDNRRAHWVENNSDQDRVTVIICIRTEKFGRHLEVN